MTDKQAAIEALNTLAQCECVLAVQGYTDCVEIIRAALQSKPVDVVVEENICAVHTDKSSRTVIAENYVIHEEGHKLYVFKNGDDFQSWCNGFDAKNGFLGEQI